MKLTFKKEKETKGTWRYKETAEEGKAVIGTLYIRKAALADLGNPNTLIVTLEKQE